MNKESVMSENNGARNAPVDQQADVRENGGASASPLADPPSDHGGPKVKTMKPRVQIMNPKNPHHELFKPYVYGATLGTPKRQNRQ